MVTNCSNADKIHGNCILPDLHNDLTEEQLVLQQNFSGKNEQFIKLHIGINKWLNVMKMTENTLLHIYKSKMPSGKLRNTFMMKNQKFCTSEQTEMMELVRFTNSTTNS